MTAACELRRGLLDAREAAAGCRSAGGPCAGGSASPGARPRCRSRATGTTGAPVSSASRPTPRLGAPSAAGARARALGEDHDDVAALEDPRAVSIASRSPLPRSTGNAPSELSHQARIAVREQLALGDEVHRPAHERADHERIEERAVVGGDDDRRPRAGCARGRCGSSGSRGRRTARGPRARASRRVGLTPRPRARARKRLRSIATDTRAGDDRYSLVESWSSIAPRPFAEPSPARSPPRVGGAAAARQAASSASTTTTPSCSARRSRAAARGRPSAGRCISPTARCSARCTRASRRGCRSRRGRAARSSRSPSTSRRGR